MTTADDEPISIDEGLRQLSRLVLRDETLETTLERIVLVATRALDGVFGASITLRMKNGDPYTAAATSPGVQAIDEREYAVDEGPCISALDTGEVQLLEDTETESRWPKFTKVCREEGIASSLGVPLEVSGAIDGAMNLYAAKPHAFDEGAIESARLLAEQAGVALANTRTYTEAAEQARQLQEALETRVVIEQAKGVLMGTERIDADAAFDRLKTRSQRTNRKLRLVAEEVVAALGEPS